MKKLLSITVATLALVAYSPTAFSAFEGLSMMRMGEWEVDFSGNVNAFYTFVDCDGAGVGSPIIGGLACGSADGRDFDVNDVRTGLLPSWLNFYAVTETDNGWKTAVHLSFQPGVDGGNQAANGGIDGALGLNTSNFRQVFLTLSGDKFGTLKIGRDLGVFGSDAINNDMTLLGVGTVGGTTGGGNTSLGRIGVGYIYADWKAQVQYESPKHHGASFTVAVVDPWAVSASPEFDEVMKQIARTARIPPQEQDRRGVEGKINYDVEWGDFEFSLWLGAIYQSLRSADPEASNVFFDFLARSAFGVDYGGIVKSGPFSLVGYRYTGNGIGTTGFLRDGIGLSANGGTSLALDKRDSDGFYVQGTFVLPDTGTKLGLSYGESNLRLTGDEENLIRGNGALAAALAAALDPATAIAVGNAFGNVVKTNESWIAGVYHPLGEALNLVAEYTSTTAEAHNGHKAEENVFALGAIMFF